MIFELDRLHFEAAQTRVGCIVRQHEEVLRKRVGETDRKHLTRVVILISKPSMPLIERDQDGALATSLSTKDKTSLVTNANWRGDRGDRDRRVQEVTAHRRQVAPACRQGPFSNRQTYSELETNLLPQLVPDFNLPRIRSLQKEKAGGQRMEKPPALQNRVNSTSRRFSGPENHYIAFTAC